MSRLSVFSVLGLLGVAGFGCTGADEPKYDARGDDPPTGDAAALDVVVDEPEGRGVYHLTWTTPEPADARVVYGEEGALDHEATGKSADDGLSHTVTLAGLAAGVAWSAQAVSNAGATGYASEVLTLTPAPPPDSLLPIEATIPPSADARGFYLTKFLEFPDAIVAILDRQGRYVWWEVVGRQGAFRPLYDADAQALFWLTNDHTTDTSTLWRCPLDGHAEAYATIPAVTHHDFQADPRGGWYIVAYDEREVEVPETEDGSTTERILGDQLLHLSADGATVTSVWSSWDDFPYAGEAMYGGDGPEYPHTNSLEIDLDRGLALLSLYVPGVLAAVDLATGDLAWKMAGEDSDWAFGEGEMFSHQHSPVLLDGGNTLVLMDNGGMLATGDYSEGAAYALDRDAFTATRTWNFDDGGIHASITMGSVVPTDTAGGMLVAWGSDTRFSRVAADGTIDAQLDWDGEAAGYTELLPELAGSTW